MIKRFSLIILLITSLVFVSFLDTFGFIVNDTYKSHDKSTNLLEFDLSNISYDNLVYTENDDDDFSLNFRFKSTPNAAGHSMRANFIANQGGSHIYLNFTAGGDDDSTYTWRLNPSIIIPDDNYELVIMYLSGDINQTAPDNGAGFEFVFSGTTVDYTDFPNYSSPIKRYPLNENDSFIFWMNYYAGSGSFWGMESDYRFKIGILPKGTDVSNSSFPINTFYHELNDTYAAYPTILNDTKSVDNPVVMTTVQYRDNDLSDPRFIGFYKHENVAITALTNDDYVWSLWRTYYDTHSLVYEKVIYVNNDFNIISFGGFNDGDNDYINKYFYTYTKKTSFYTPHLSWEVDAPDPDFLSYNFNYNQIYDDSFNNYSFNVFYDRDNPISGLAYVNNIFIIAITKIDDINDPNDIFPPPEPDNNLPPSNPSDSNNPNDNPTPQPPPPDPDQPDDPDTITVHWYTRDNNYLPEDEPYYTQTIYYKEDMLDSLIDPKYGLQYLITPDDPDPNNYYLLSDFEIYDSNWAGTIWDFNEMNAADYAVNKELKLLANFDIIPYIIVNINWYALNLNTKIKEIYDTSVLLVKTLYEVGLSQPEIVIPDEADFPKYLWTYYDPVTYPPSTYVDFYDILIEGGIYNGSQWEPEIPLNYYLNNKNEVNLLLHFYPELADMIDIPDNPSSGDTGGYIPPVAVLPPEFEAPADVNNFFGVILTFMGMNNPFGYIIFFSILSIIIIIFSVKYNFHIYLSLILILLLMIVFSIFGLLSTAVMLIVSGSLVLIFVFSLKGGVN